MMWTQAQCHPQLSLVIWQWLETDARMRSLMSVYDIKRNIYTVQRIPGLDSKVTFLVTCKRGAYTDTVGCNGILGPANKKKFECDEKMVKVQQYFEHIELLRPDLPCVRVGSRDKRDLVPVEMCWIQPGPEYRRILKDIQTTNMIKGSATPAQIRKKKIFDAVKVMNSDKDSVHPTVWNRGC